MRYLVAIVLAYLTLLSAMSSAYAQLPAPGSSVWTGVGRPRPYLVTVTSGDDTLTDGTDPVLVPWNGVVQISCPELTGTDRVLACFSMHIDGAPDVTDGHLSDPDSRDSACHGMYLDAAVRADDMALDLRRFRAGAVYGPGAQFVGACNRPGTNYHLAPCSVAGEAIDCGAASTCEVGFWLDGTQRAEEKIAGAWLRLDGSAATTGCIVRIDI